ncbi:MAG: PspC domain-containing protein [Bacteroidales bacterium]|nr:PspC domain-containing protein [Bacteroidales bacterium]MDD3200469.1 PspC domain-containing protein [Bacteroidales bacterium]
MKKVINVGIGGRSFTIDEDAYRKLDAYLNNFRTKAHMGCQTKEVMDDLEMRIAELFEQELGSKSEVVNLALVNKVISQLGMPDGSAGDGGYSTNDNKEQYQATGTKRFYRDPDNNIIGGVCSGLAAYFNIDIVLVRILFVIALLLGSAGFWAYIIFWIVAPKAVTAAQKCEMRGWPVTAENMGKFSQKK